MTDRPPHQIGRGLSGILRAFWTLGIVLALVPASIQAASPSPQAGTTIPYLAEKEAAGDVPTGGEDYHFAVPASGLRAADTTAGSALTADDFNRANLDEARWSFVNPLNDGQIRLTGAGTGNAHLELTAPAGVSHDPWGVNRAVRVMQATSDVDFSVVVKYDSVPAQKYQMQGVIVEQDADNWLRLELQHDGSGLRLVGIATTNGSSALKNSTTVAGGAAAYLRVTRTGSSWLLDYGTDGTTWPASITFSQTLAVTAVGPYAANHASGVNSPPAYTARVDYVANAAAPIADEDAAAEPDIWAPLIHTARHQTTTTSFTVTWYTDEPTQGTVESGATAAYGSQKSDAGGLYAHSIVIGGLTPGATLHYRISAKDSGGRTTTGTDVVVTLTADGSGSGPTITVWYGDRQSFGQLGLAQNWVNILGNVSDVDGIKSLTYKLNGGSAVNLTVGPDGKRLQSAGDFNVDLVPGDLKSGDNTLVLTATDMLNNVSSKTVTVAYTSGTTWPSPYQITWSSLGDITDLPNVAQVIDGKWRLDSGGIRIEQPGYDRLLGLGDVKWRDYEITVPVTMHSYLSGDKGVGMILRWTGHTAVPRVCAQPQCGWMPLGTLIWYHGNKLELYSYDPNNCDNDCVIVLDEVSRSLSLGKTYWFKARVETTGNTSTYRFKVWEAGQSEPVAWDLTGTALPVALDAGAAVLLTHRYDTTFGDVQVTPLGGAPNQPPVARNDAATVSTGGSVVVNVTGNDSDSDGTLNLGSVTVLTQPTHGTTSVNGTNGRITYFHAGDSGTTDSFTYLVKDNDGAASNVATVAVTINGVADTTPPVITLNGAHPLTLEAGSAYVDPGARALDSVDGDISGQIVVGGAVVDTGKPGSYVVTYNVSDSSGNAAQQVTRTVQVVDTSPPVIDLLGASPLEIEAGSAFDDPGATAQDLVDGDLSAQIVVGGDPVNTQVPGTYAVTYAVQDSSGNAATPRTRVVTVVDTTAPTLVLLGDNPMVIPVGTGYQDPGATAADRVDGDLTGAIVTGGDVVDTSVPGEYTISYEIQDSRGNMAALARTVQVVDTTPPVLLLLGANPLILSFGTPFVDPGVVAVDGVDGNLLETVIVGGDAVNSEQPGIYVVTYDVADAAGNAATQVRRTVRVLAAGETAIYREYLPFITNQ